MQEKLLAMDEDVVQAALFAQQLSNDDLTAVEQSKALTLWITEDYASAHREILKRAYGSVSNWLNAVQVR